MSELKFLADENFGTAIMPDFAYQRVGAEQKMPGLIVMRPDIRVGTAIDDILLITECLTADDLTNGVLRLPL